jgi:hypothetical protein
VCGLVSYGGVWQANKKIWVGGWHKEDFMVYEWKQASRCKVSAQVAGEVCEELNKTGGLTAQRLLDASRAEDAPLHSEFEWRDDVAAEEYRKDQARHIIQCLTISVEEKPQVRAFLNIETLSPAYIPTIEIMSDEEKTAKMLENALRELDAFQKKYSTLTQLNTIFEMVEKIKEDK